ncbi:MAG: glycerophosphodiester phosphodiesterase [Pseudobdellovibrionaceae bacterium]
MISDWVLRTASFEAWPDTSFQLPPMQAHRGYWLGGARENTLSALIHAKKVGAQMSEFDVRMTRDQIPVLFHDKDLVRTTGEHLFLEDLSLQELKNRCEIDTLEEALLNRGVPDYLNIEIKSDKAANEAIERKVTQVIQKTKAHRRVMFSSFNPVSIWKLSQYLPQVPRALLVTNENHPANQIWLKEMWTLPFLKVHLIHYDQAMLEEGYLAKVQELRIPFAVWTVNTKEAIDRFLSAGAKSVITDTLGLKETINN